MNSPQITYRANGELAALEGREAVECYNVAVLISAIGLLENGIQPTGGFTMKKALAKATQYTGRAYKRTETATAKTDLKNWLELMKSTIPTRVQS